MGTQNNLAVPDPEINAITVLYDALRLLDREAQLRVVQYVASKLGIGKELATPSSPQGGDVWPPDKQMQHEPEEATPSGEASDVSSAGINVVAQKWMTRNGLNAEQLGAIFSVGGDEIDLIAKSVPGKSKRNKMHSIILLKGIAAYLGSGAPRVSHQQIKETCLHYNAFDSPNFAKNLKEFAPEVSGSKESGYTLTARGLSAATGLAKQMTQGK